MVDTVSQIIIEAMRRRGLEDRRLCASTGITSERLDQVIAGKKEFTDAQLRKIELLTGTTIGVLGASVLEPAGGPLTELVAKSASARSSNRTPKPAVRTKPRQRRVA